MRKNTAANGAKVPRQSAAQLYRERVKAIKPYLSFKLPKAGTETKAQQNKARKYFQYLIKDRHAQPGLTSGVKARVRRKDPAKLLELQKSIGQGQLKGVKYAFVPSVVNRETGLVEAAHITETNELPIVRIGNINVVTAEFDRQALVSDTVREVDRVMAMLEPYADKRDVARFRVATGDSGQTRMYQALTRAEVIKYILELMRSYHHPARNAQQDVTKWVHGLSLEFTSNQRDMKERENAYTRKKEARLEIRKMRSDYGGLLEVVTQGRDHVGAIVRKFAGRSDDDKTQKTVKEMVKNGLLKNVSDYLSLTQNGRAYFKKWTDMQEAMRQI